MKCLRRYCCALFSCVLLLIAFSSSVSAENIDVGLYHVFQEDIVSAPYGGQPIWLNETAIIEPNNEIIERVQSPIFNTGVKPTLDYSMFHQSKYTVAYDNGAMLFSGESAVKVRLENVWHRILMTNKTRTISVYYSYPSSATFTVKYVDGTTETFGDVQFSCDGNDGNVDLLANFIPKKDVSQITFIVKTDFYKYIRDNLGWETTDLVSYEIYVGEWSGDNKYTFSVDQQSEESGLLSGLIGWVKNIFDSVKDGFSALGDGLNNVWNSILELPSKIWEFIENGLKSLFVPTEEYIVDFKERIDSMLAQKLGAVYQVINLLLESWDRINVSDATDTIEMPQATINVGDGEEFAFGGYDVQVVPDGFDTIVNLIKLIVGISCTVLFVNGLRHRYDEVMGVEK